MSNDVQSHEEVAESRPGEDRRGGLRHAARSLGSVTARIIGGSQVDLVNFSNRGVLFECDSRLLIGARASVRITTRDANLLVTGRVVRSRVKGLVNGALRYDAALVLDKELALAPAIVAAVPTATDDLVSFESDFEDPSPVEAYLAESEASLLDVASGTDVQLNGSVLDALDTAVELPPPVEMTPAVDEAAAIAAAGEPIAAEDASVAVEADPVAAVAFDADAFDADAEIAFEPSVEFAFDGFTEVAFDDRAEALPEANADVLVVERIVIDEPAGSSMFDATYIPPAYETQATAESLFEVTSPMAAPELSASSSFDARPSENYGEAPDPPAATAAVEEAADLEAVEAVEIAVGATDGIDFESAVAFEAEDAVMFEASFEDAPAEPVAELLADPVGELLVNPVAHQLVDPVAELLVDPVADPLVEPPVFADPLPTLDAVDVPVSEVASDDIDPPAAVPVTDDRVLLQFAATVPHDLAELRRIAADNQW